MPSNTLKPSMCLLCGGRGAHEGPGHAYTPASVVVDTLDAWIRATNAYSECERGLPPAPLALATTALVQRLRELETRDQARAAAFDADIWLQTVSQIALTVNQVAMRFISDQYSDDDTDAPCDVEWDVHSLLAAMDPAYEIPEEIEPSHVVGTVFPHPSDDA